MQMTRSFVIRLRPCEERGMQHHDASTGGGPNGTRQSRRHVVWIPAGARVELAVTASGHTPAAGADAGIGWHERRRTKEARAWRRRSEDDVEPRPRQGERTQEHWPQEDDDPQDHRPE